MKRKTPLSPLPRMRLLGALAFLVLGACTSTPQAMTGQKDSFAVLEEAPPQEPRPDQCHLALWTREEPSRRVLVAFDRPGRAIVKLRGKVEELPLVATGGSARHGHFERQTYSRPRLELVVDIRFDVLPGAVGVSAIRAATISLTEDGGETVVTPVVGIVSCGAAPVAAPPPA